MCRKIKVTAIFHTSGLNYFLEKMKQKTNRKEKKQNLNKINFNITLAFKLTLLPKIQV